MKLIEDGNLTATVRGGLMVLGAIFIFTGLGIDAIPNWLGIAIFLLGIVAIFVGGISSRAKLIGLRPFGESSWRKAKRTYKEENRDSNK